jgi:hypothetical protein
MILDFKEERKFLNKKLRKLLIKNFEDERFPYLCYDISFEMADVMKEMEYFKDWRILVVRGHFNDPEFDKSDVMCGECIDNIDDYVDYRIMNGEYKCEGCTCEKIKQHTYIKAYLDASLVIFDFTKYQFDIDNISAWHEDYVISQKSKEELVDDLIKFNNFIPTDHRSYYSGHITQIKGD